MDKRILQEVQMRGLMLRLRLRQQHQLWPWLLLAVMSQFAVLENQLQLGKIQ